MSAQEDHPTIKIAKEVREVGNQDGAALLDIEQGLCFSLNPVGAKIWEMLKHGRSPNEITDALEQEFQMPRTQLFADISDFFKQLESMRLLSGRHSNAANRKGFFSGFFSRLLGPRRCG